MIATSIRNAALNWPSLNTREATNSMEFGIVCALLNSRELYPYLHEASGTEKRTLWLIVVECLQS